MSKLPGLHSKACGPGRKIEFERQQNLFDKCFCGKQQNDFTRTGKLFDKYFCANRKVVGAEYSGLFQDNLLSADDVHAAPFGPDDTPSVEVVNRAVAFLLRQGDVLNALGQCLNLFQRILH